MAYMGATPDGKVTCSCCGTGILGKRALTATEVKVLMLLLQTRDSVFQSLKMVNHSHLLSSSPNTTVCV